jgi:hypothetical protein
LLNHFDQVQTAAVMEGSQVAAPMLPTPTAITSNADRWAFFHSLVTA